MNQFELPHAHAHAPAQAQFGLELAVSDRYLTTTLVEVLIIVAVLHCLSSDKCGRSGGWSDTAEHLRIKGSAIQSPNINNLR